MVMILQRFSQQGLGLSQRDASQVTVDNLTFDIEEDNQVFRLFGRRTFGSPVSPVPKDTVYLGDENATKPSTCHNTLHERCHPCQLLPISEESTTSSPTLCPENLDETNEVTKAEAAPDHISTLDAEVKDESADRASEVANGVGPSPNTKPWFFKSSWKENSRDRECDIIETAHIRAEKYLKEYSGMVTNHIPKLKVKETCALSSTSRVRLFMKDVGGNKDLSKDYIKQHGRTRIWMVSRKLKPITKLRADDFWKVFWDIVRCTRSCFYFS